MAVTDQRGAIALLDQPLEQLQIAAKAEDIGRAAAEDKIFERNLVCPESLRDQSLPAFEITQHGRGKAGSPDRIHEGPERAQPVIVEYVKLLQLEQFFGDRGMQRTLGVEFTLICEGNSPGHSTVHCATLLSCEIGRAHV